MPSFLSLTSAESGDKRCILYHKTHKKQGKAAIFACGKTGTHVGRVLSWAKEQGARRGEFVTTGAVAMVVGMPNVGKSSLINLLRGKATNSLGGGGENAKKVYSCYSLLLSTVIYI